MQPIDIVERVKTTYKNYLGALSSYGHSCLGLGHWNRQTITD